MKPLSEPDVRVEVLASILGTGPAGTLRDRLAPQLLGDAERLEEAQALDTGAPVLVLGPARPAPIPRHKISNPSRDHALIYLLTEYLVNAPPACSRELGPSAA